MMFSTHIVMGGSLGLLSFFLAPQLVPFAVAAGMIGGFLPDIDMFMNHRKTSHRPFQFLALTVLFVALMLVQTTALTVFTVFLMASMALHTFAEILSNGKTMRPREEQDERCVYNHVTGEWIKPKRYIIVGSFRDLVLTLSFGAIMLIYSSFFYTTLIAIVWGTSYVLVADRVTERMKGYDRFSEYFQHLIGFGPEVN